MCVKTLWICVEKQICTHVPASSTACRHKCVLSVPSCADAAALPVGIHETQSNNLQVLPDVTELVESSQGSPITYPPVLMQLQCQGDSACAGMTPPSSMVIRARSWFLNLNWDLQMACVFLVVWMLYSLSEKYGSGCAAMVYNISWDMSFFVTFLDLKTFAGIPVEPQTFYQMSSVQLSLLTQVYCLIVFKFKTLMSLQVILQAADCTVRTPPVQARLKTGSVAKIKHASRNSTIQKIFQMHKKIMKADV